LAHNISRSECTVLFVGYQARGTLGRQILDGNKEVRIHGRSQIVRAHIEQITGFSGHPDREGLLDWLSHFKKPPRQLFLTHGELDEVLSLAQHIRDRLGWQVTVPEYRQTVELE
jgi:metallo-beta-lactamase family protein